jgi:hypothetical protein
VIVLSDKRGTFVRILSFFQESLLGLAMDLPRSQMSPL